LAAVLSVTLEKTAHKNKKKPSGVT
jgi:hypothetical protein